jgi:tRNA-Thr(GGU) m(6)t(6)A37 methyltransferase TsaA
VRSPLVELADAPRQAIAAEGVEARIELVDGRHLEDAVADLDAWERIWVLFWFDRAGAYRPKVLPPRSTVRRGVLGTRAPHRPNPIGLSAVRLLSVRGRVLHIADVDMIDGTPVLDIKPYVPYADAFADAGHGWLEHSDDPKAAYPVRWSDHAEAQLGFLAELGVELREPLEQRLGLGPEPHAYRRIKIVGDRRRLAYKDWRVWFRVDDDAIIVEAIETGYRPKELAASDPALEPHRLLTRRDRAR